MHTENVKKQQQHLHITHHRAGIKNYLGINTILLISELNLEIQKTRPLTKSLVHQQQSLKINT